MLDTFYTHTHAFESMQNMSNYINRTTHRLLHFRTLDLDLPVTCATGDLDLQVNLPAGFFTDLPVSTHRSLRLVLSFSTDMGRGPQTPGLPVQITKRDVGSSVDRLIYERADSGWVQVVGVWQDVR